MHINPYCGPTAQCFTFGGFRFYFSYSECIAVYFSFGKSSALLFTKEYFSKTTSRHMASVRKWYGLNIPVYYLDHNMFRRILSVIENSYPNMGDGLGDELLAMVGDEIKAKEI